MLDSRGHLISKARSDEPGKEAADVAHHLAHAHAYLLKAEEHFIHASKVSMFSTEAADLINRLDSLRSVIHRRVSELKGG